MLGMLRHNLQQGQLEMLKKKHKVNSQNLLNDSLTIDIEDTNDDFYLEEEFNEELLQVSTEAADIDMGYELTIENLFDLQMFAQNREETIERSSIVYSQTPTGTNEDWSIDDIFH
ncbi:6548_t:CDS:1 [Scutellospora calospora]|uniref:6548_t:CDS:1 n=1 Tax=Scutellospora calospora TaxID=85575 RepID=A0ACA9MWI6_9GLOM|nr:6548_t:CDS:1 [Scutellospora calospora]